MSTPTALPHVRGSSAPRGKRLASSVRLPWLVGLGSLLVLAVVVGVLAGRGTSSNGVVHAVLDAEEATAVGAAQSVRRSLNEGSDDLLQVVRALDGALDEGQVPTDLAQTALLATSTEHGRYAALGLVEADSGRTVLPLAGTAAAAPMGELPDDRRAVRVLPDGRLVQSVPLRDDAGLLVAAVYDPAYLVPALLPAPQAFHVVDERGRALTAPGAVGLGRPLPDEELRRAADLAAAGRSSARALPAADGTARVVAAAPVDGIGPGAEAELTVVASRLTPTSGSEASPYRVQGVLAALALALLAGALFAWLHLAVVRPLLQLQQTAERVAYGDLSRPVPADRFDEIGTAARALERMRLALIRAQVQDLDPVRTQR